MKIKICIKRSESWVNEQRIITGENIQEYKMCEADTAEFSQKGRAVLLLCGSGAYCNLPSGVRFDNAYNVVNGMNYSYGSEPILIDSDDPTVAQIEEAIFDAISRIVAYRDEYETKKAEREREAAERKAEADRKEKAIQEARILLDDELSAIENMKNKIVILSKALERIPLHILNQEFRETEERQRIEDASPLWIFDRE